jgi:hypothetical protein
MMSMLEVRELEGLRFKKYVLRNTVTGIVIDQRFWTARGAVRKANKNLRNLNKTINRLNMRYGKV